VIGGILASTLLAILFTPMFFWILESMSEKFAAKHAQAGGAVADSPPAAVAATPPSGKGGE